MYACVLHVQYMALWFVHVHIACAWCYNFIHVYVGRSLCIAY